MLYLHLDLTTFISGTDDCIIPMHPNNFVVFHYSCFVFFFTDDFSERLTIHRVKSCRIYLMGQSAGAHIAACALLEQAAKESRGEQISWSVTQIKAYFGLSGGWDSFII